MAEVITFIPSSEQVAVSVPAPKSAKHYIPKWYKEMPFFEGGKPHFEHGKVTNMTPSACMPFTDSFLTGYIQEAWTDISIEKRENGSLFYNYANGPMIMEIRGRNTIPTTSLYLDYEFLWTQAWIPKVSPGYSVLITHPLNRFDLPFQTLSAIVDADEFYHTSNGNIPFYLNTEFTGVIPAGTPLYQIIPIHRATWNKNVTSWNDLIALKNNATIRKFFWGGYKKLFHQKKHFND